MRAQFRRVERELRKAARRGKGRDKAVHQLRKALQRLRGMLRLLRELDPIHLPALEAELKLFRRRFGRLRDAAVRLDLARELAADVAQASEPLQAVSASLQARLAEVWQSYPDAFWSRAALTLAKLEQRAERITLDHLRAADLEAALERARRRARQRILQALGLDSRVLRHRMRCKIRRYAAMRRLRNEWTGRRDALATTLVDLGKRLGREGDLWLSAEAVHTVHEPEAIAELRRQLRQRRRELVRQHDGELAAWLRRCFAARERGLASPAGLK